MQANTPWEMLPSRQRTRSAPRNSTRFAAQYSARGLPCERFTAVLTDRTSCITRGRGGWLDLPRGGLAPPILCQLSWRTPLWVRLCHARAGQARPLNIRFLPDTASQNAAGLARREQKCRLHEVNNYRGRRKSQAGGISANEARGNRVRFHGEAGTLLGV